mmetsp:Transcript_12174/g.17506  ORF Transcript_12174/g.17506 Transcript_12174/m.17506 type:complete len:107 (-) Transcript_12174:442-762(-)
MMMQVLSRVSLLLLWQVKMFSVEGRIISHYSNRLLFSFLVKRPVSGIELLDQSIPLCIYVYIYAQATFIRLSHAIIIDICRIANQLPTESFTADILNNLPQLNLEK